MNNTFNYKGKIIITTKRKGITLSKTTYNNGTEDLFRLLCKALAGYSIADERISKLGIKTTVNNVDKTISVSCSAIAYRRSGDNWETVITAAVPYDERLGNANSMGLYSLSGKQLTKVSIDGENIFNSLVPGSQALIEWHMSFSNAESASSDTSNENESEEE